MSYYSIHKFYYRKKLEWFQTNFVIIIHLYRPDLISGVCNIIPVLHAAQFYI
jgi:hypothetical protein